MDEEFKLSYQKYLEDSLNLYFNDSTGIPSKNIHYKANLPIDNVKRVQLPYECISYNLENGTSLVRNEHRRYNYLDINGKPLSKQWLDSEVSFNDGYFSYEKKNGKFNYLDINGNPLSNHDFESAYSFHEGYAVVKLNGKYNFIDTNGHFISDEWYEDAYSFENGYARVVKGGRDYFIDKNGKRTFDESFYKDNPNIPYLKIEDFIKGPISDGWALVNYNDKYNFIDVNGNFISKKWFDNALSFSEGVAFVSVEGKHKFIDTKGISISDNWKIEPTESSFKDGFACAKIHRTYNFVNKEGKILIEPMLDYYNGGDMIPGFRKVKIFNNGYFQGMHYVRVGGYSTRETYQIIDTNGKVIKEFDSDKFVRGLGEGFILIRDSNNEKKYYIIDNKGKYLYPESFDNVEDFKNGKAVVIFNGLAFTINKKGELTLLSVINGIKKYPAFVQAKNRDGYFFFDENGIHPDKFFDEVKFVSPGVYIVKKDGMYNLFYLNDLSLFNEENWYSDIKYFEGNYGAVKTSDDEWRLIQVDTKKEFKNNNKSINYFRDGYAIVKVKKNFTHYQMVIDMNGKSLISCNNEEGKVFIKIKDGLVIVKDRYNDKIGVVNLKGEMVIPYKKCSEISLYPNFVVRDNEVIPRNVELGKYEVNKSIFGYQLRYGKETFRVKGRPVKNYFDRYILCLDKSEVVLYDKTTRIPKILGSPSEVSYDDNFIYLNEGKTVCLMTNGEMIDISKYYHKHLINKKEIHINSNIIIKNPDVYFSENEEQIRNDYRENLRRIQELKKQTEIEEEKTLVKDITTKRDYAEKANMILQLEALRQITEGIKKLEQISKDAIVRDSDRITPKGLFITVNDHKEINPYFIELGALKIFNLSGESFKDVRMSGIDFRGCNISFNPQNVYNKDLSNCNFEGISFLVSTDFTDVNICGTKFTNDGRPNTFDINAETLKVANYDENTTLNGIALVDLIEKKERGKKSA